jgi:hypothetical protein
MVLHLSSLCSELGVATASAVLYAHTATRAALTPQRIALLAGSVLLSCSVTLVNIIGIQRLLATAAQVPRAITRHMLSASQLMVRAPRGCCARVSSRVISSRAHTSACARGPDPATTLRLQCKLSAHGHVPASTVLPDAEAENCVVLLADEPAVIGRALEPRAARIADEHVLSAFQPQPSVARAPRRRL